MLISQNWLTRILQTANPSWSVDSEDLDAGFVRVGFETEGYERLPKTEGPLVIGKVSNIEELEGFKKPIRYCEVAVGEANGTGEPQNIICGARNFAEGDYVIVALPGTVLPGPFEISARKTYGKISEGMMCSASELGLYDGTSPGIITVSGEEIKANGLGIGDDARGLLGLDDTVFEVNVTPDRGYALSARGLARELASSFELQYRDPALDPAAAALDDDLFAGIPGIEDILSSGSVRTQVLPLRHPQGRGHRPDRRIPAVAAARADALWPAPRQRPHGRHELRHDAARPADARLRRRQDHRQPPGAPRFRGRHPDHP